MSKKNKQQQQQQQQQQTITTTNNNRKITKESPTKKCLKEIQFVSVNEETSSFRKHS